MKIKGEKHLKSDLSFKTWYRFNVSDNSCGQINCVDCT